jgi:hypothetical protein
MRRHINFDVFATRTAGSNALPGAAIILARPNRTSALPRPVVELCMILDTLVYALY